MTIRWRKGIKGGGVWHAEGGDPVYSAARCNGRLRLYGERQDAPPADVCVCQRCIRLAANAHPSSAIKRSSA